ncbi:MAG: hypothetical protein JWR51_852 [Devosia sp.]|uniref:hypothetical protein n=1 Tax=Devosia sp. TaxID=1871048 RepID=UPI00262B5C81|nr:hypothetical protein [Devosia sp.]MDB5527749.1 hypothetical protein [Devosia sp.]
MLIGAITLLIVLLIALTSVILLDMRKQGWANWLTVLHEWQQTLGTVVGFLGAAGVLVLGTALTRQADEQKAMATASSIGQALAYEAERLTTGLELGRRMGLAADPAADDVAQQCTNMALALNEQLQSQTPVFDASIQRLVDFGTQDLANFVRFYSFYAELRHTVANINADTCAGAGAAQLGYMINQMKLGLGYYQVFAPAYPIVQYGPDGPIQPGGSSP